MKSCQHPKPNDRKTGNAGVVTVELALVLPLALFITFSLVEFSRVNIIRNTMQNAAYEGARAAIIRGGTAAAASTKANAMLSTISIKNPTVQVIPAVVTNATSQVEVKITVPLGENMWVTPKFFASTTMVKSFTLTRESTNSGY